MSEEKFVSACAEGDLARLKRMLELNPTINVNYGNSLGETALMVACRSGYSLIVRYLVEELKVALDQRFPDRGDGWTALMYAVYYGRLNEIRFLVESGADYTLKNSEGLSVLDINPFANAHSTEIHDIIALALQTRTNMSQAQYTFSGSYGITSDASATTTSVSGQYIGVGQNLSSSASHAGTSIGVAGGIGVSSNLSHALGGAGGAGAAAYDVSAAVSGTAASKQDMLSRRREAEQYLQQSPYILSDIVAARPKMIEVYQRICGDFNLTPDHTIMAALCNSAFDLPDRGQGALVLRQFGFRQRLGDLNAVPALEVLAYAFPNAPLHTISITWAGLGDISMRVLAQYLESAKVLCDLNLDGNVIGEEGGLALAHSLEKVTQAQLAQLKEREASYQQQLAIQQANGEDDITTFHLPPISKMLEGSYNLRALTLASNPLGDICGINIVQALIGSPTLQVLDLSDTQIGPHTLVRIVHLLKNPSSALLELYIDSPMTTSLGEETTMHIANALPYCRLEKLSLARHRITDTAVSWIAEGLSQNVTITELNLRGNRITVKGVAELARALKSRSTPCFINLDFNDLEGELLDELDAVLAAPIPVSTVMSPEGGVQAGCVVQFDSGSPLSLEETDTFQHQRHWLVSRALEPIE